MQESVKSEFWDFSLEVYQREPIRRLCLDLQDNYGADVNMLLFACWLGHSGRGRVTVSAWRAMILRLSKWRDRVIKPLRNVRRMLQDEQLAPPGMKQRIEHSELEAEQVEQLILEKEWGRGRRRSESDAACRAQDMIENLAAYLCAEHIPRDLKLAYRCERLVRHISGLLDDKLLREACHQAMGLRPVAEDIRQDLTVS